MRTNHREVDIEEVGGVETLGKFAFIRAMGAKSRGEVGELTVQRPKREAIQIGSGSVLKKCGVHDRREADVFPFNVRSPEIGAKKMQLCLEGADEFLKNAEAKVEGWYIVPVRKKGADGKLVLDVKL